MLSSTASTISSAGGLPEAGPGDGGGGRRVEIGGRVKGLEQRGKERPARRAAGLQQLRVQRAQAADGLLRSA